jgi:hypothetical protein
MFPIGVHLLDVHFERHNQGVVSDIEVRKMQATLCRDL